MALVVPDTTRRPYHWPVPAKLPLKVTGLELVPNTRKVPWAMSSTRVVSVPDCIRSLVAAVNVVPGDTVRVTPGDTVRSPASESAPERVVSSWRVPASTGVTSPV